MPEKKDLRTPKQTKFRLSPKHIIVMTLFIDAIGFGIVYPLLPFYSETFQAGSTAMSILVASFFLMNFIFSPILGRVSDKVGRKPVLLISILTSLASYLLFASANSFLFLLVSRIFAGLATEVSVGQAYITDITSKKQRASGMGMVGAAHGAGFIIGPGIAGLLSVYGFSAPGFAAALLTLVNLLFVIFFLPESLKKEKTNIQLSTGSIRSFVLRIQNSLKKPLVGSVLIIFFIGSLSFSALPVIGPLLGQAVLGFGSVENSYVFMYIGVVGIILQAILIGKLTEKFGEKKLLTFSSILMMMGFLFMPLITELPLFILTLTMNAVGWGIVRTVVPSYISKTTSTNEQGSILGVINSVSSIAFIPGPLIGGFLFEFVGLAIPFFASASIMLIAVVIGFRVFFAKAQALKE